LVPLFFVYLCEQTNKNIMSIVADVNHIYKLVSNISNKEQKGYLKASEFNTFLQQAEYEVLEDNYFKHLEPNKVQRGIESDFERTDALLPYLRQIEGTQSSLQLPNEYMHIVGVYTGNKQVKYIRHSELGNKLNSTIVGPSESSPIYTIAPSVSSENAPIVSINFYTSAEGPDIIDYRVVYITKPKLPPMGHWVANPMTAAFDASLSTALDAPKSEHDKIAKIVLQYMGIHLKDTDILSFATSELNKD